MSETMGSGLQQYVPQLLDIPPLSTRHKYLKLTTMYNIFANHSYPISLYDMIFLIVLTIMQILLDLLPVLNICIHPLHQV